MQKIAVLTADTDLYDQTSKLCAELDLESEIGLHLTKLSESARLASSLQQKGMEVLIARGGLAMLIKTAEVKIPVVEIVTTGQDLARICLEARVKTQKERPNAAFIAFDNMITDVEIIATLSNVNIAIHRLQGDDDIPRVVEEVAKLDYDVVFGGIKTTHIAREYGLSAILLQSGELSIKNALLEARRIVLGRQIEKENAETFRALTEYSLEGVISVDSQKRIQVVNPVAARLLGCLESDFRGRQLDTLIELPGIDACLNGGQEIRGAVLKRDNTWLCVNVGPIIVEKAPIGAFVTFQEISRIQEAEAVIRNEILVKKFAAKYALTDILGQSPQIVEARRIAREIARTDATTLIHGASGTGKELFAQSIHTLSERRHGPFVAINCAALPPNLLESELFGYVEGAFTGATKKGKPGLFEMAHRGTLFLDEISEMDKYGQSRLLRALQERQIMRLGGDKYIPVDVRVIAASNRNLLSLIESGQFREDLYYRLKVLVLNLPRLCQRTGDIDLLTREFLRQHQKTYRKAIELTDDAYGELRRHAWPGNVRELSHFIERLLVTASNTEINGRDIRMFLENREYEQPDGNATTPDQPVEPHQEASVLEALQENHYNIKQTAARLGIARQTLYRKMSKLNIRITKSS